MLLGDSLGTLLGMLLGDPLGLLLGMSLGLLLGTMLGAVTLARNVTRTLAGSLLHYYFSGNAHQGLFAWVSMGEDYKGHRVGACGPWIECRVYGRGNFFLRIPIVQRLLSIVVIFMVIW